MRKQLIVFFFVFFVFFLVGSSIAQEFSADLVSTTGGVVSTGKIFASKDKVRMELPQMITISRQDKGVVWMLMPQEKTYLEQPFKADNLMATSEKIANELERNLVGKEEIDGKMASKYKIAFLQSGKKLEIYQWIASGSNIPLKTQAVDGSWTMEYKNLITQAPSVSMFEIPAGYTKLDYNIPAMDNILKGLGN
ncbi:MAG: hypothetical protein PHO70_04110 [Candidatus Omnitrophica bacterium]|nr:hypothetical protein [Candidatus Omnitrophota bacterium]